MNEKCSVSLELCSPNQHQTSIPVQAITASTITDRAPQTLVTLGKWTHLSNLQLADPQYYEPGPVDLLLGAEILPSVLINGLIAGAPNEPIAMNTIIGWVGINGRHRIF